MDGSTRQGRVAVPFAGLLLATVGLAACVRQQERVISIWPAPSVPSAEDAPSSARSHESLGELVVDFQDPKQSITLARNVDAPFPAVLHLNAFVVTTYPPLVDVAMER